MNKERVKELVEFIKTHQELPFDMSSPLVASCGTAGCIGGFAAALWPELQYAYDMQPSLNSFSQTDLRNKLDISYSNLQELCFPADNDSMYFEDSEKFVAYEDITRKGAIATLERLAETGEVSWLEEEQRPERPEGTQETEMEKGK